MMVDNAVCRFREPGKLFGISGGLFAAIFGELQIWVYA
jgi:hypothetical protein